MHAFRTVELACGEGGYRERRKGGFASFIYLFIYLLCLSRARRSRIHLKIFRLRRIFINASHVELDLNYDYFSGKTLKIIVKKLHRVAWLVKKSYYAKMKNNFIYI